MDFSQLKAWVLGASVLALFGCGTVSKPTEHIDPESLKVASKVASIVGDARPGDRVSLPSNSGLGMDSVVVDRTYFSASGRQCRRMRTDDGTPIPRVACKGSDGVWSLARDLRPNTSTAPTVPITNLVGQADQNNQVLVPSAGSMLLSDNAEHLSLGAAKPETEMVTRTVSVNETLWSFAKRTTGNALNWQTIARINGISDAKSLSTGTQLLVPVNLVGQGG